MISRVIGSAQGRKEQGEKAGGQIDVLQGLERSDPMLFFLQAF